MKIDSTRIGNKSWCQSCLKRRVNKGYSQCLFCQKQMTAETIDYYKAGDAEKQRLLKVPKNSKDDYALGFLDGQNKYQDDYSMNAAFGFDL